MLVHPRAPLLSLHIYLYCSMPFDYTNLKRSSVPPFPNGPKRPPPHNTGERFLKGPIPWNWLCAAARCSGHAFHVGIFLWWLAGVKASANLIVDVSAVERELDVGRHTVGRALDSLAAAGLVVAARHPGRKPRVTLLSCPSTPTGPVSGLVPGRTRPAC